MMTLGVGNMITVCCALRDGKGRNTVILPKEGNGTIFWKAVGKFGRKLVAATGATRFATERLMKSVQLLCSKSLARPSPERKTHPESSWVPTSYVPCCNLIFGTTALVCRRRELVRENWSIVTGFLNCCIAPLPILYWIYGEEESGVVWFSLN